MTEPPYAMQPPPGAYPYPPPQPPQPQQPGSGLAIASLVLGIIAVLLSWIPIVNYVAVILGVVGLVLGIIGIFKSKRTMSIVGAALSLLAIIVSFIAFASFAKSVDDAVNDINSSLATATQSNGGSAAPSAEAGAHESTGSGDEQTNDRGNLVAALGDQGGVSNEAGDDLLTFSVDSITVDPPCSPDWKKYGTPVDAGHHLVAVDMQVTTSAAVTDADYLSLSGYDFKFIGADGITVDSLESAATYGCLDDSEDFTSDMLGPGQKYAGTIVLDLPSASGTLVLDPSWGQSGGWEYSF